MYLIQVFQFTCCSNLVAFKFQVNKKTQNHISVYLQECGFESFCILLFERSTDIWMYIYWYIYYLFLGIVNNLILSYLCTQKNKLKD